MQESKSKEKRDKNIKEIFILFIILLLLLTFSVFIIKSCFSSSEKMLRTSIDVIEKLSEIFSTKESFNKTLGPIISESPHRRLQFYQRDQVALFRIIRYRGRDDKLNHDYVQCYKKESDKIQPDELPIFLKQYCIWEAKGTYEFNFYIDLGDLDKWDYKWDKEKYSLTLFPPDIGVNTPAEIENLQFTKIKDSVSIDETYTRRRLEEAITSGINGEKPLKIQLAEEQKKLFYNQAREAIKDLYIKFLSKIPNIKIEKYPEIIVVFPHEREKLHLSKKKL